MKILNTALVLVFLAATPLLAGLKVVATPDQTSYNAGGATTGSLDLNVVLDGASSGEVQFLLGPITTATSPSFSFVGQSGSSLTTPALTGANVNVVGGWQGLGSVSESSFAVFRFGAGFGSGPVVLDANTNPSTKVGSLSFAIPDGYTNGLFDVVISDFSLDGVDVGSHVVGTVSVVGIPEPSSFLFLGLAGSGIAGIHVWRRRRHNKVKEADEVA